MGRSFLLLVALLGMGLSTNRGAVLSATSSAGIAVPAVNPVSPSANPDLRLAQGFIPNADGMPGRREGGGTRGQLTFADSPPTALIPKSNLGATLAASPTLYFYVPEETAGLEAEVLLMDGDGNTVYQAVAPLPAQAGVVSVPLPADLALEPERFYQWFFSVLISQDDPSANIILSGWLWRVPADSELATSLAGLPLAEQPTAYTEAGLWFDALNSIAELRRANPGDATAQGQWAALLEAVELEAIAPQPLLSDLPVAVSPSP